MAQRRMLAKSISTSKKINRVSDQAALLFSWTLPHCDDYGNMDGSVDQLKAIVVPSRKWSSKKIEGARNELCQVEAWKLYEAEGEQYIHVEKFDDFQTFKGDRDKVSLYPKYKEELRKPVDSTRKPVDSYKLSEVKLIQVKGSEAALPTPQDISRRFFSEDSNSEQDAIIAYLVEKGINENVARAELSKFVAYWTELSQSGRKQRWEAQKFFDLKRRLATWFKNVNKFNGVEKKSKIAFV